MSSTCAVPGSCRVAVIGAGLGGLAAALRLQAAGIETTVLEAREEPGGQAHAIQRDGFTFCSGPAALADRVTNAGAIFVGPHSPVSLGDYLAGSNHVLPTGGQARYAAGLSASTFLRPQQVIEYDRDALAEVSDAIVALATAEVLPAHGEAVRARFTA